MSDSLLSLLPEGAEAKLRRLAGRRMAFGPTDRAEIGHIARNVIATAGELGSGMTVAYLLVLLIERERENAALRERPNVSARYVQDRIDQAARWHDLHAHAALKADGLAKRCEKLEAALRPFAELSLLMVPGEFVEPIRAARAALSPDTSTEPCGCKPFSSRPADFCDAHRPIAIAGVVVTASELADRLRTQAAGVAAVWPAQRYTADLMFAAADALGRRPDTSTESEVTPSDPAQVALSLGGS